LSTLDTEELLEREASLELEASLEPVLLLLFALQERLSMLPILSWKPEIQYNGTEHTWLTVCCIGK
jgi:hypothetical protein